MVLLRRKEEEELEPEVLMEELLIVMAELSFKSWKRFRSLVSDIRRADAKDSRDFRRMLACRSWWPLRISAARRELRLTEVRVLELMDLVSELSNSSLDWASSSKKGD